MNCFYCGLPVPAPPKDEQEIALLPECVHLGCVDRWAKDLEVFTRPVVEPVTDSGPITFRKYAPLTTVTATAAQYGRMNPDGTGEIQEAQLGQRQGE